MKLGTSDIKLYLFLKCNAEGANINGGDVYAHLPNKQVIRNGEAPLLGTVKKYYLHRLRITRPMR